jgi:molybdate transport system substrate-binding protein
MTGRLFAAIVLLSAPSGPVVADEVRVAVASNFAPTLNRIAPSFERQSGDRLLVSAGSTGKLYAQIVNGAPFDVFLAADVARPQRLELEGFVVDGTRFTYALGRLVLWSPRLDVPRLDLDTLTSPRVRHVAMANPRTAPYGQAAQQVLRRAGLWERIQPHLVFGEDVGQTYQFVATGNAEAGFVALSQLRRPGDDARDSIWIVPTESFDPIDQQAVLLRAAPHPAGGRAFLSFLGSSLTREMLVDAGYGVPAD